MTFAEKLSSLRKQANLTQSELADKLNVSRQAVTKWESGIGLPDIDNCKKCLKRMKKGVDLLSTDSNVKKAFQKGKNHRERDRNTGGKLQYR